jgi:hypothetical protein
VIFFPLHSLIAPVKEKKHVRCLGGYVRRYGVVAVHYHRQGLAVIRLLIKREVKKKSCCTADYVQDSEVLLVKVFSNQS